MRRGEPEQGSGRQKWSRFWWMLLLLLILNWFLASALLGAAPRASVSYTFFLA